MGSGNPYLITILAFAFIAGINIWRVVNARRKAQAAASPAVDDLLYHFAHRALPSLVHRDDLGMLALLVGRDGPRFLDALWKRSLPPGVPVAPGAPALSVSRLDDRRLLAMVTMPAPRRSPQAWFVALVVTVGPDGSPAPGGRAFTLERSLDIFTGADTTVLGEWDHGGTHRNFGAGPSPEVAAFTEAVLELLDDDAEAQGETP